MDSKEFYRICQRLVADYRNEMFANGDPWYKDKRITADDVYVVWSTKVLQNNKALLSTPISDGMYYEVTYNGEKNEIYFDAYKKETNVKYEL